MATNICQQCKREFISQRKDKKCCSPSCQWQLQNHRAKALPSEAMLSLGLVLKSAAPDGTVGYRLALRIRRPKRRSGRFPLEAAKHEVFWFPTLNRKSLRWDGSYSEHPYFVLTKTTFEPPRVPKATSYLIEFLSATGLVLRTPPNLEAGVVIAEASRMSWPGTHHVRQPREGAVRDLVELASHAKKD